MYGTLSFEETFTLVLRLTWYCKGVGLKGLHLARSAVLVAALFAFRC